MAQTPIKQATKPVQGDPAESEQVEGELVNKDMAEISPEQQMQIDEYSDNATIVVFGEQSQAAVLQLLQVDKNPVKSVAKAANMINQKLQGGLEGTGEKMSEIALFMGAAHLVSELIVLAEAAKLFSLSPGDRLEAFRQTLMMYFAEGLKNGTIDPVKLQQTIEPLMSREQRAFGLKHSQDIMKTPPVGSQRPAQQVQQPQQAPQQGGILGGA